MTNEQQVSEDLYFHLYPIVPTNRLELQRLVRTSSCNSAYETHVKEVSCALNVFQFTARKKIKNLQGEPSYDNSGKLALLDIFEKIENSKGTDHIKYFLTCLSIKKLSTFFNYKNDAQYIEMIMGLFFLDKADIDYVVHLGIQRNMVYACAAHKKHHNISMILHGLTAKYVLENFPKKKLMITNPVKSMRLIFKKEINESDIHNIENRNLIPIRDKIYSLDEKDINHPRLFETFNIWSLTSSNHTCVTLRSLSFFSTKKNISLPASTNEKHEKNTVLHSPLWTSFPTFIMKNHKNKILQSILILIVVSSVFFSLAYDRPSAPEPAF